MYLPFSQGPPDGIILNRKSQWQSSPRWTMLDDGKVLGLAIGTTQWVQMLYISSAQLMLKMTVSPHNTSLCMGDQDSMGFGTMVPAKRVNGISQEE